MTELLEEILKRVERPDLFVEEPESGKHLLRVHFHNDWQARAVATLFETAEPAADSKLRTIDLPAELEAAAKELRCVAEGALQNECQDVADRLGFLANVVEETSHLITEPARMLAVLMHDRDQWQVLEKQAEEMLSLTEAALGVSQKSNVALAEGQSTLIGLLERVARGAENDACERGGESVESVLPEIHAVLAQVTAIETDASGRLGVAAQTEQREAP